MFIASTQSCPGRYSCSSLLPLTRWNRLTGSKPKQPITVRAQQRVRSICELALTEGAASTVVLHTGRKAFEME